MFVKILLHTLFFIHGAAFNNYLEITFEKKITEKLLEI